MTSGRSILEKVKRILLQFATNMDGGLNREEILLRFTDGVRRAYGKFFHRFGCRWPWSSTEAGQEEFLEYGSRWRGSCILMRTAMVVRHPNLYLREEKINSILYDVCLWWSPYFKCWCWSRVWCFILVLHCLWYLHDMIKRWFFFPRCIKLYRILKIIYMVI